MANTQHDTIVAIATAPGRGGVGVLRISGTNCTHIARSMLGALPRTRHAILHAFKDADGNSIDTGLVLYFAAPASFTGEDVLELHGHGSPVVLDMLLHRVIELGARLAEPGEFSRRAFLNDKLDLVQAEAIADLIGAESAQSARAAMRSLQGEFSDRLHDLTEALIQTRMHVEAAIDFPEEELDLMQDQILLQRLQHTTELCNRIRQQARSGSALREGMTVVIAGKPNAGKSSVLNCLAGYEAAIVTDLPGTTRDVLRERILVDGMPIHILDTAGLREASDRIEAEGVRRAHAEIRRADHLLYVVDASNYEEQQLQVALSELPSDTAVSILMNKCDLIERVAVAASPDSSVHPRFYISTINNAGIDHLREHLKLVAGYVTAESGLFLARRRHLTALQRASDHIQIAQRNLLDHHAGELCAEELRLAQNDLAEITGEFTSDDLLGRIFSSFCIGK